MIKTNSTEARQAIFKPATSTSATLCVFHTCFLWSLFFCSFLAGSVPKLCVSVHAGGCGENESSLCRAGPVVSVCWKPDRMSLSFNVLHTHTQRHACFAFPAGIIKEERWVGSSLFLHCIEMLMLAYYGDKADWIVIFPCLFLKDGEQGSGISFQ